MQINLAYIRGVVVGFLVLSPLSLADRSASAAPTVKQALGLAPVQAGIDYDRPAAGEVAECSIKAEKEGKTTSWVIRDASAQTLRRFADTNADNLVDRWSYFKAGFEVYCDIDASFNGKADQYRWFNTSGSRWGIDKNEDGKIDQWRVISAEEAAAEVVQSLRTRDARRFACLLMTTNELKALGLGPARAKQLQAKVESAAGRFRTLTKDPAKISSKMEFVDFVGTQPGIVPTGTAGSTRDLLVYENVVAMVQADGKHDQIPLGTLIQVGSAWRLVDVPVVGAGDSLAPNGFFFQTSASITAGGPTGQSGGPSLEAQKLMSELERLDRRTTSASPKEQARLNAERADLLERLAVETKQPQERAQWIRQLADTVGVAVQSGSYPDGVERLKQVEEKLAKDKQDEQLLAYVMFRRMSAAYAQNMQAPGADFAKIQAKWLEDLQGFVEQHPKSSDTAEALLQLAITQEFCGQDEKAIKWYGQILADFPGSMPAKKATGAKTRLQSVGNAITLHGRDLRGRAVDLTRYRGKTVLIQYWATWCEPCITDMARIKELVAKYTKRGFRVIGVSLDSSREDVVKFLQTNRLPWQQIYEPGGLESRLANEMGILTLPTMILIGGDGRVVNRSIHVTELDSELGKLLR